VAFFRGKGSWPVGAHLSSSVSYCAKHRQSSANGGSDGTLSDVDEAAFELIEPKGKGWRDVNVPARMAGEPSSDLVVLAGGVVVNDEVDVELGRHIGVNCGAGRRETPDGDGGACIGR